MWRLQNVSSRPKIIWPQVVFVFLVCFQTHGQIPGPARVLDPQRARLYQYISSIYSLNNTNVPVYAGQEKDLSRLAKSPDPFVRRVAQQCLDCITIDEEAQKKSAEIGKRQEEAVSRGETTMDAAKAVDAEDNFFDFAHVLLNSGTMERFAANQAIQREAAARIGPKESEVRLELAQDFRDNPRGVQLDKKSFALDFTNVEKHGSWVVARLGNNTGRALHNCMLVANVTMDGRKVDAERQANAMSESIAAGIEGLSEPGNKIVDSQLSSAKSTDLAVRNSEGGCFFAPEWLPGQWVEIKVLYEVMLRFANPGELNVAADEGFTGPIQLPLELMTAVSRYPVAPPPVPAKTPEQLKADEETLKKQHESVTETGNNGIILYEFLSYPGVWSEAVVPPPGTTGFNVRWAEGMKIKARVSGRDVPNPGHFTCSLGDRLRFMSAGDQPVPTAVRIVMRKLTPDEKAEGFVMPPWPPPIVRLPPDRQSAFDGIADMLTKSPSFTGAFFQDNKKYEVEASLSWDAKSHFLSGWINFPGLKVKKEIEGRIIDDGIKPLYLQLVETRFLEKPSVSNALLGIYYSLNLDADAAGKLTGKWQWNQQNIGHKGTITLNSAAK